ncbi:SufE family protein [Pseudoalteromonas xiamenensis]|uniref:SufE family protein n=1 Tax=Pseudoalteromonas xiamenensis TaxID=882626 RepID=A0A975HL00_9GAMM|nr:SufE family protein [Pseudoalteromonas xiamenensis]QTH71514.1 SufE family protein [Pseudoalteromonas xiamenensis]
MNTTNNLIDSLRSQQGWQAKYRQIMLLGKQLPTLPEMLKTDDVLVKGCESKVWLHLAWDDHSGCLVAVGDSDTRIVKGLLAIILAFYNGKRSDEINQMDVVSLFEELELIQHLSPSRGNGIHAINEQIKTFASA